MRAIIKKEILRRASRCQDDRREVVGAVECKSDWAIRESPLQRHLPAIVALIPSLGYIQDNYNLRIIYIEYLKEGTGWIKHH